MFAPPPKVRIRWTRQYRIIASSYPPIDFFERLDLDVKAKHALAALLMRTDAAFLQHCGNLRLLREEDIRSGPLATVVMTPFTLIGAPTRFTDGSYGVYYAGHALETAIRETVYHRERDARERALLADEWDMTVYIGQIQKPLYDVRAQRFAHLHDPEPANYPVSQAYAKSLLSHDPQAWGLVYRSVRHSGGECVAAFRPPAVSLPTQGPHLVYVWDGAKVASVYEKSEPLLRF